jgi:uncharacterized protein
MRKVARLLLFALGAYACSALAMALLQRRFIYMPPAPVTPAVPPSAIVRTSTGEGLPVVAYYLRGEPDAPVVVHFHGNGDQLAETVPLAESLHARGVGVFAVEYPGYGLAASATPTERNLYSVAHAAIDHLLTHEGVALARVVLHGHSLGAAVAAEMAARGKGSRLILVAPFTSMKEVADRMTRLLPNGLLLADHFDTLGKAARIHMPTWIVASGEDEIFPLDMSDRLARAIGGAKRVVDPEAHHNDVMHRAPYEAMLREALGR